MSEQNPRSSAGDRARARVLDAAHRPTIRVRTPDRQSCARRDRLRSLPKAGPTSRKRRALRRILGETPDGDET